MRVLIADKVPSQLRVELVDAGFDVDFQPSLTADSLPEAIGQAQVLVVRSTKVTQQALMAAGRLQLIVRAGAGTNTIDCDTAAGRGVYVANTPGRNAVAVAELAFGLILSLDRQIPDNVIAAREGRWAKKEFSGARGLKGRTLGIIGLGRIGQAVALRARAFEMNIIGWDRLPDPLGIERCDTVRELCSRAEVITIHVPLTPETRHLIGKEEIAAMRTGAMLVHTARGGVVDDQALAEAVAAGRIRAATDVYEQEPGSGDATFASPLKDIDGFYGTHHIGASTQQAQEEVAAEVKRILLDFVRKGIVRNAVNVWESPPAAGQLFVRHLDQVGVLAAVFDVLRRAELNVQDMENTVFAGGDGACAKITLSEAPTDEVTAEIRSRSDAVLGLEWVPSEER